MAKNEVLETHKATIKRHLEESLPYIPLDQIHAELVEIFQYKGRYTLPQITAITSWLKSQKLQDKRTSDIDWKEDFGDTSEDIDYNTPAKIISRNWHFQQIANCYSEEQRKKIQILFMPGRNKFDYNVAVEKGFSPTNMVTYMRGDEPAANAEYIRNSRKLGVTHRRLGDMEDKFPKEDQVVQAAYLDFFGMYCPSYAHSLYQLPVDPNADPLCISINLMEGREHKQTGVLFQQLHGLSKGIKETESIHDEREAFLKNINAGNAQLENPVQAKIARERALMMKLFAVIGAANTKNWIAYDAIKAFVQCRGEHKNFDEKNQIERFDIMSKMMMEAMWMYGNSREQFARGGIPLDLMLLGLGTRRAMVNSAQVKRVEPPERYVSPNGNRPFISFFGELATHRDQYLKYEDAMRFYLRTLTDSLPKIKRNEEWGYFDTIGHASNKLLRFRSEKGAIITTAKLDYILEAQDALTKHDNDPEALGISKEEWTAMGERKERAVLEKISKQKEKDRQARNPSLLNSLKQNSIQKAGRNDLCPCGSGRKYKKCCLQNN